jgi:hypothetical protein
MECTISEDARCNSSVSHSDACKWNLNFSVSIIFLAIEREAKFVLVRILVIGHLLFAQVVWHNARNCFLQLDFHCLYRIISTHDLGVGCVPSSFV